MAFRSIFTADKVTLMAQSSPATDIPPQPIDRLIGFGAPDHVALISREGSLSYAALEDLTGRVAAGLIAAGANRGDRVASWMGKTLASAVLPFACARAGLVHVPVNPLLKAPQVEHILADSGAKILLTLRDRVASLQGMDSISILSIEDNWENLKSHMPLIGGNPDPDSLAALLYTSGSTGRPKGVMVSHANLWLGAESVARYLELCADDRVLALLPFSFDYGLSQMLAMFRAGGTVVLHDFLLAKSAIKALDVHEINVLAGVPPLWMQLVDVEWPDAVRQRIRVMTNSGGAMPPSLSRKLRERCPNARFYLMYGLTEAFRSTYLDPALADARPESIGTAIPHAEVLVVRPDGSEADAGEAGELVHCGPLVAQGYWRDSERTAQRFRPAPSISRYGGTAVWSGDYAVRGEDGLITFVGRADEMIKTAGYRVSPTEIEDAALATGAVAECAAFGVADDRLGQAIHLVARVAAGQTEEEAEARLLTSLRQQLPNFMQPARVHWRGALPRNPNGKLDRTLLKTELSA